MAVAGQCDPDRAHPQKQWGHQADRVAGGASKALGAGAQARSGGLEENGGEIIQLGSKGKSPQAAVWRLALRTEAAMARGEESAAALIDLAKAFEYVRLELVWEAGIRWHFPGDILRLMLETFAFVRHLVLNGAMSEAVATL